MNFKEYLKEAKLDGVPWQEVVKGFDKIESAIIEPDGRTVRVKGEKNGKFEDSYVLYRNDKLAKNALKEIQKEIK